MDTVIMFDQITVTTIDTSSGLFVGQTNHAHGWSSQSKTNMGMGTFGDHNELSNNISLVVDNDQIDSPMIDNRILIEGPRTAAPEASIQFRNVEVDTMDTNASVAIGDNSQSGWSSKSKNNYGNGQFIGQSVLGYNRSQIQDDDVVDMPILK